MDFLSLALRTLDLDGAGPRLHAIDLTARALNPGGATPLADREAAADDSRCTRRARVGSDEAWLGAEAMVDPTCAALLRRDRKSVV